MTQTTTNQTDNNGGTNTPKNKAKTLTKRQKTKALKGQGEKHQKKKKTKNNLKQININCDASKPGDPLTNYQPTKDLWMSSDSIPHCCVPFTRTHNLIKIGQSLICTRSSTQNTTCMIYNNMIHPGPNITQ